MTSALHDEARQLYLDAKLASFAGRFEEADAKHRASAIVFERLGENELSARAYMRALWYRIQSRSETAIGELVETAQRLSIEQTAAGLHQAIEFALFEGSPKVYDFCCSQLETVLDTLGILCPTEWYSDREWGDVYCRLAEPIYLLLTKAAAGEDWEKWKRSDQARVFYFNALLSPAPTRSVMLEEAAALFARHEIDYRAKLCQSEANIWKMLQSTDIDSAGAHTEEAIIGLRSIGSFSLGVLGYRNALLSLAEVLLFALSELGYSSHSIRTDPDTFKRLVEEWNEPGHERGYSAVLKPLLKEISTHAYGVRHVLGDHLITPPPSRDERFQARRCSYFAKRLQPFKFPSNLRKLPSATTSVAMPRRERINTPDLLYASVGDSAVRRSIVFIHGLSGHFIETWGSFPDLLESDPQLTGLSFMFWGFPTGLIGRKPGLRQVADALATEMRVRLRQQELVIVAHSLGGLITKQMIISEAASGRSELLNRVRHLIFFGTPHIGSSLAMLKPIFSRQVDELALNNELLTQLEREWMNRIYRPVSSQVGCADTTPLVSLTNVYALEDRVVSEWSSITVNNDVETVQGTHSTMVKPQSSNDLSYLIVKDRVCKAFNLPESKTA